MKVLVGALAATLLGLYAIPAGAQDAAGQSTSRLPRFALVRVYTVDHGKSERFYRNVFEMRDGPGSVRREHVLTFADSGTPVLILALVEKPLSPGDATHFAVVVGDLDDVLRRTVEFGGRVAQPAHALGGGARIAFIRDPDGNRIEIFTAITMAPR